MKVLRVYADTSVFGGCFDEEFGAPSQAFFEQVRSGRFRLLTAALVEAELEPAPLEVRRLFDDLVGMAEIVPVSQDAVALHQAYLDAGVLSPRWATDALHVALATMANADVLVSWNFKHLVHLRKIPLYNAVNTLRGHPRIAIHSPREVIAYEDEDV